MPAQKHSRRKHRGQAVAHDSQAYERFLKGLKLLGLGLQDCAANLNRGLYFELQKKESLKQVAADYEVLNIEDDFFNALASFQLEISEEKSKKDALSIKCSFVAHFHFSDSARRDHIKRFVESEMRLIVWPYFRQFVNDLTTRMAVPALLVPLSEPE